MAGGGVDDGGNSWAGNSVCVENWVMLCVEIVVFGHCQEKTIRIEIWCLLCVEKYGVCSA